MNLNEQTFGRGRGRGKRGINRNHKIMVPPRRPGKRTDTTESSVLNWGKNQISVLNESSVQKSALSSKSSSEPLEPKVIIALTEGRGEARCEVGMAVINVVSPKLILCQISDTHSYINTLIKINVFNPTEILFPETFLDKRNRLIDIIQEKFKNIKFTKVTRNTFNRNYGLEKIEEICIPSLKTILLVLQHKYYALAAASALLNFARNNLYIYYSRESINVEYQESEGFTIIDVSTADHLELVASAKPRQACKYSTLFGVLNNCVTRIGSRTLRSTILQPPCDTSIIEDRLDCIEELIKNPEILLSTRVTLQKLSNVDQLLSIATIMPTDAHNCSNRQLNYILLLNSLLELIMPLKESLKTLKQRFFIKFIGILKSEDFNEIRGYVRSMIHENAQPSRGQSGVYERCFAIKSGVNGLLDLVRKTYSERIEDMNVYVKNLSEKYNLPLTLGNNHTKGHHIILKLNQHQKKFMKKSDLPAEFIQVFRLTGSYTMKTYELINLSTRLEAMMVDILQISNIMIYRLLVKIKPYIGLFYQLCEGIAQLDTLQSLAETSVRYGYVRPKFSSYTKVNHGHHPMLDFLCSENPVPNSISCCTDYNIHIITGPNGAGKSIYIRQLMLLQIMAQIGCYVPAESATFRTADRMIARVYLEDNMECGASAFVLEIKELIYIMNTLTPSSLVIIDELCRSTGLEEGVALAMAICEYFTQTSAFIYVTTHFTLLTKLAEMYCNIKTWQMETIGTGTTPEEMKLAYKYNLIPGVMSLRNYGVYLARNIWPENVMRNVYEVVRKASKKPKPTKIEMLNEKLRVKYDIEAKMHQLKTEGKLTQAEIDKHLEEYKNTLETLGVSFDTFPSTSIDRDLQPENDNYLLPVQQLMDISYNSDEIGKYFTPEESIRSGRTDSRKEFNIPPNRNEQEYRTSMLNDNYNSPNYFGLINNDPYAFSDSSSYKRMCDFIQEQPDNINALIPEVNLTFENQEYSNDYYYYKNPGEPHMQENFENFLKPGVKASNPIILHSNIRIDQSCPYYTDAVDMSMNEMKFSLPLVEDASKTSTPVFKQTNLKTPFDSTQSLSAGNDHYSRGNYYYENSNCNLNKDPYFPSGNFKLDHHDMSLDSDDSKTSKASSRITFCERSEKITNTRNEKKLHQEETSKIQIYENNENSTSNALTETKFILETSNKLNSLEISSIVEDLTLMSEELENDLEMTGEENCDNAQDSNNFSKADSSQRSSISPALESFVKSKTHCIFPVVNIVEGPNDTSLSFATAEEECGWSPLKDKSDLKIQASNLVCSGHADEDKEIVNEYQKVVATTLRSSLYSVNEDAQQNRINCEVEEFKTSTSSSKILDLSKSISTNWGVIEKNYYACSEKLNNLTQGYRTYQDKLHSEVKYFENPNGKSCEQNEADTSPTFAPIKTTSQLNNKRLEGNRETEKEGDEERTVNSDIKTVTNSGKHNTIISNENISSNSQSMETSKDKSNLECAITSNTNNILPEENRGSSGNNFSEYGGNNIEEKQFGATHSKETNLDNESRSDQGGKNLQHEKISWDDLLNTICNGNSVSGNSALKIISQKETTNTEKKSAFDLSATGKQNLEENDSMTSKNKAASQESARSISRINSTDENAEITPSDLSDAARKRNLEESSSSLSKRNKLNTTSEEKTTTNQTSPSSSVKESDVSGSSTNKTERRVISKRDKPKLHRKFIAPRKLTAKEIREDFQELDRKLLESSTSNSPNFNKYLAHYIKRPSVKQLQNATHLAFARKTESGVEVIPAEENRTRKKKTNTLPRNFSSDIFDVSIFSDQNAEPFEKFLNSNERDYKMFNFHLKSSQTEVITSSQKSFHFRPVDVVSEQYTSNSVTHYFSRKPSDELFKMSQSTGRGFSQNTMMSFIPDGFYKQNKDDINNIVNKYLQPSPISQNIPFTNRREKNIFENSTTAEDFTL